MNGSKDDSNAESIETIRSEINDVDKELLLLLSRRRGLSLQAVKSKSATNSPLRDQSREEQLLVDRILTGKQVGLDSHYVTRVFQQILDDSLRVQREFLQKTANVREEQAVVPRIAVQGIEGSYSDMAARHHFARKWDKVRVVHCATYREVFDAVEQGTVEFAVVPVENTISGGNQEVYEHVMHRLPSIVGEETLQIEHCLLALEGTHEEDIKKIYCHPNTMMQCSEFLSSTKDVRIEYGTDTAGAGRRLKEEGDKTAAAIASEEAARIHGLKVLKKGIANQEQVKTRFLVLSRTPLNVDPMIPCKTSLVLFTRNEPGALVKSLQVFEKNGINLTRLESRAVAGNPLEEQFLLDFEGSIKEEHVKNALDELSRSSRFVKVLGCYPTDYIPTTKVKPAARPEKEAPASDSRKLTRPAPVKDSASKDYRLGSREFKSEDTLITVGDVTLGGDNFVVIAGPCSVESEEQIMECARVAKEHGAGILRGGCFKPRTNPYSFQGLGFDGLKLLRQAGDRYDLPVVTEVLSAEDVRAVAEVADIIQIGARNMQNFTLLKEVGKIKRPVMLKRGMSASISELLQAAEYILDQGNQQVFLCERGIRTFETATRSTLDISAVPVLKSRTHLPVIVDPSHAAGVRDLVPALSIASKAVGAHGVMVEMHPCPEKALSDGPQSLHFEEFAELMSALGDGRIYG